MAKDPAQRYATPGQLRDELDLCLEFLS